MEELAQSLAQAVNRTEKSISLSRQYLAAIQNRIKQGSQLLLPSGPAKITTGPSDLEISLHLVDSIITLLTASRTAIMALETLLSEKDEDH